MSGARQAAVGLGEKPPASPLAAGSDTDPTSVLHNGSPRRIGAHVFEVFMAAPRWSGADSAQRRTRRNRAGAPPPGSWRGCLQADGTPGDGKLEPDAGPDFLPGEPPDGQGAHDLARHVEIDAHAD